MEGNSNPPTLVEMPAEAAGGHDHTCDDIMAGSCDVLAPPTPHMCDGLAHSSSNEMCEQPQPLLKSDNGLDGIDGSPSTAFKEDRRIACGRAATEMYPHFPVAFAGQAGGSSPFTDHCFSGLMRGAPPTLTATADTADVRSPLLAAEAHADHAADTHGQLTSPEGPAAAAPLAPGAHGHDQTGFAVQPEGRQRGGRSSLQICDSLQEAMWRSQQADEDQRDCFQGPESPAQHAGEGIDGRRCGRDQKQQCSPCKQQAAWVSCRADVRQPDADRGYEEDEGTDRSRGIRMEQQQQCSPREQQAAWVTSRLADVRQPVAAYGHGESRKQRRRQQERLRRGWQSKALQTKTLRCKKLNDDVAQLLLVIEATVAESFDENRQMRELLASVRKPAQVLHHRPWELPPATRFAGQPHTAPGSLNAPSNFDALNHFNVPPIFAPRPLDMAALHRRTDDVAAVTGHMARASGFMSMLPPAGDHASVRSGNGCLGLTSSASAPLPGHATVRMRPSLAHVVPAAAAGAAALSPSAAVVIRRQAYVPRSQLQQQQQQQQLPQGLAVQWGPDVLLPACSAVTFVPKVTVQGPKRFAYLPVIGPPHLPPVKKTRRTM